MFRIRRKRAGHKPVPDDKGPALARDLARALVLHVRILHRWKQMLESVVALMPKESRVRYEMLSTIELRPDFEGVLRMIDQVLAHGLITEEEAVSLRAGQTIQLAFPDVEE
jgi:hypothetical protein